MTANLSPSQLDNWSMEQLNQLAPYLANWEAVRDSYLSSDTMPFLEFRNGLRLEYRKGDPIAFIYREIFVDNCYSAAGFYSPKSGDVVVDIGANIGLFTLYLTRQAPGLDVHCYEPSSMIHQRLQRNLNLNDGNRRVTTYCEAVMDAVGQRYLYDAQIEGTRSMFRAPFGLDTGEQVTATTLSNVCDRVGRKIDLLKIDTEGSEFEILAAADGDCWRLVRRVALEYHEFIRAGIKEDMLSLLRQQNFSRIVVSPHKKRPNDMGVILADHS